MPNGKKDRKNNKSKGSGKKKPPQGPGMESTKNAKIKERAKVAAAQTSTDTPVITFPMNDNTHGLYSDEILPKLEKLAAQGLNNKEIAESLAIGERTFYEWRDKYPQFAHSLKKYRGVANILVENALFKTAVGFDFQETTIERRRIGKDPKNPKEWLYEMIPVAITNKHIPGNPISQIFYLKNRMPERYKDKVETVINLPQDISQIAFAIKRREE